MSVKYEDDFIKSKYRAAMDRTKINETGKNKVRALAENRELPGGKNNATKITHRITKTAAGLITFICVLAVGGGIAWAMTVSPLKDYFFPKNDRTFETVFAEANKEYNFGDFVITYSGYVYDAAVGRGYLQFDFTDSAGNPIDVARLLYYNDDINFGIDNIVLTRKISVHGYKLGNTDVVFLFMNNDSLYTIREGSNVLVKFSVNNEENIVKEPVRFIVLNKSEWEDVLNKVEALDEEELCTFSYDLSSLTPIFYYDRNSIQPEVAEILNKFNPIEIKNTTSTPQIIEAEGLKVTVGRMDILFEYNTGTCNARQFIIKRKDGTELIFNRNDDESWSATGIDKNKTFTSGKQAGKMVKKDYTMGFVLDPDEEVTIEIN